MIGRLQVFLGAVIRMDVEEICQKLRFCLCFRPCVLLNVEIVFLQECVDLWKLTDMAEGMICVDPVDDS